ncbi:MULTISPECIES: hypothetical protein [Streptomyces]
MVVPHLKRRKTFIVLRLRLHVLVSLLGVNTPDEVTEIGHAQVDSGVPGLEVAHGGTFLLGGGEAGPDRGDLAEPPLFLGLLEPVAEVRVTASTVMRAKPG